MPLRQKTGGDGSGALQPNEPLTALLCALPRMNATVSLDLGPAGCGRAGTQEVCASWLARKCPPHNPISVKHVSSVNGSAAHVCEIRVCALDDEALYGMALLC